MTDRRNAERIRWDDAAIVAVPPRPQAACPACGSFGRSILRSVTDADGGVTRRCVCRRCGEPFIEVEDPALANSWQE